MNAPSSVLGALLAVACHAQTGLVPINDLGTGSHLGFQGGLYPGGSNTPPPGHLAAALLRSQQIVPRNATGQPDADGLIVMIAIGMSNTCHEFAVFERQEDANPRRNARVVIIDTALGGQTAAAIANPAAQYWTVLNQRLAAMGVTPQQVQVAWMKEADANPPNNFPVHAQTLRDELEVVANNLLDKFPQLKICYVSSRIYGGYATGSLNPEPQAYQSGFSVKWLIESQISGDPGLNYGQWPGIPPEAPLLMWGPYLWADGPTPRSDGLVWLPGDFESDGTHPAPSGEQKVADLLSAFFAGESTADAWWPRRPDAALVAIDAQHDAFVRAAEPNANFGQAAQLAAQGGPSPQSIYLGFNMGPAARPVRFAKLGLRVVGTGGGPVSRVESDGWHEDTITYSTAPATGAGITTLPQVSKDGTYTANVTAWVNTIPADPTRSFVMTSTAGGQATYHSAEGGQPPRLVLTVVNTCAANCSGDVTLTGVPVLSVADFGCFQTRFVLADPYADCNGDGALTVADFGCFQSIFAAGCP